MLVSIILLLRNALSSYVEVITNTHGQEHSTELMDEKAYASNLMFALGKRKTSISVPENYMETAHYMLDLSNNRPSFITAQMFINTSRPIINFDDYKEILDINCDQLGKGQITFQFHSSHEANKAFKTWENFNFLAFFFSPSHTCGGDSAKLIGVFNIEYHTPETLSISVYPIQWKSLVREWKLKTTIDPMTNDFESNLDTIHKRLQASHAPLNDTKKNGQRKDFKKFSHHLKSMIDTLRNWHKVNHTSSNLDWNYDPNTMICAKPELDLNVQISSVRKIKCLNCYTTGSVSLAGEIYGTFASIKNFSFDLHGVLKGIKV